MLGRMMLALLLPVAGLAAMAGVASAQYPPPVGNCVVTTTATATDQGGSVRLTITVRDLDGNPVAGEPVALSITAQPGNDASVAADASATDGNGVVMATLNVGSTPGVVTVQALAEEVSCSGSVSVMGGEVQPEVIAPPDTGFGPGGSNGDGIPLAGVAFAVVALGVMAVAVGTSKKPR